MVKVTGRELARSATIGTHDERVHEARRDFSCAVLPPALVGGDRAAEAVLDAGRGWEKLGELRDASA